MSLRVIIHIILSIHPCNDAAASWESLPGSFGQQGWKVALVVCWEGNGHHCWMPGSQTSKNLYLTLYVTNDSSDKDVYAYEEESAVPEKYAIAPGEQFAR